MVMEINGHGNKCQDYYFDRKLGTTKTSIIEARKRNGNSVAEKDKSAIKNSVDRFKSRLDRGEIRISEGKALYIFKNSESSTQHQK